MCQRCKQEIVLDDVTECWNGQFDERLSVEKDLLTICRQRGGVLVEVWSSPILGTNKISSDRLRRIFRIQTKLPQWKRDR